LIESYKRVSPPKSGFSGGSFEMDDEMKKETPAKVERTVEEALEEAAEKLSDDIIKAIEEEKIK
ncbi:MAG: hypothetical protein KAW47_11210, partial [Thermoplasmatales archaeon]|nr:hypothetical protein [Thermoplasmatales archaeon]